MFYNVIWQRPKYMIYKKWEERLIKLQILENMRNQTIFFKKKYSTSLINRTLDIYKYIHSLPKLVKYFIDWESS